MKTMLRLLLCLVVLGVFSGSGLSRLSAETPEALRSPVNQVFQFMESGEYSAWSDGSKSKATAYLWIPETCSTVKGLIILGANVPEHMLVGHPKIRAACAANDLGIVWCTPSFLNTKTEKKEENVLFLQQLLDGLARTSGYAEVATVPWLPIGESGHLLMVDALVENRPDRCLAGIWLKNNHLPPKNRTTPALVIYGSAQEWSQDQKDIGSQWNNIGPAYDGVLKQRSANPAWPLTYFIDGWSGHFDCSERLVDFVAHYIGTVVPARLPEDAGQPLRPLNLETGFLADVPVPGHENKPVVPFSSAPEKDRGYPWFFDEASAQAAQAVTAINWKAQTQLPAFANAKDEVFPFTFNGISWINLNQKPEPASKTASEEETAQQPVLVSEEDGITFSLKGILLDKVPSNFKVQDTALARTPGTPTVEWLCGAVEPLGGNRFRLAIDRTWPSPLYLAVRQPGSGEVRGSVQPGQVPRGMNTEGTPQKISFPAIPEVKAGTTEIELKASADSGLPVRYFVVAGPAIIQENRLVFTPIPPKAKFPITVTVGAWQWGRFAEPKVRRAEIVRQSFQLVK
jgi:hypothetical protein